MRRPNFDHYLAANPNDDARAVSLYVAALAEWRAQADGPTQRPPRWHARAIVVVLCGIVVAGLLFKALGGCAPATDARVCVAGCGRAVDACLARCGAVATGVDVDGGGER